ncbi:hypothetical protein C8F04DRAFT_1095352 [Mycena alexandri]|uniref:BTB domain-containing protein n=1 Tax=Mycena alexandri TaxID=1745969 RepID=A0AAD6SZI2_9AGAR|nr:hypothetical protein C8F04DRAFT_1401582 [Mycena alexandri]KAJ7036362.1 hypothetical protein C8F04DRAFT_1095352 [Mycena alexandri]
MSDSRTRPRDDDDDDAEESEAPPHRRQRLEDETLVDADIVVVEQLERDPQFYRSDGDCVIRVENTLFKVHRFHFNGPAFEGLFSLPGSEDKKFKFEGQDDCHPIRFFGDTVNQLRSFLGYAYAHALHVQYSSMPLTDIYKLIDTVQIAHKYALEESEKWAVNAITYACVKKKLLRNCAVDVYVALLKLDLLSPMPTVKSHIRKHWIDRLREGGDKTMTIAHALDTADEIGFRRLLGDLYFLQLQKLDEPADSIPGTQVAQPLPADLNDVHKLRLMTGYRSLSLSWSRIAANPLPLEGTCSLGIACHLAECGPIWTADWDDNVAQMSRLTGGNLLKHVQTFQTALLDHYVANGGCPLVTPTINRQFPELIKTLRQSIADHFLGPEPEEPPA